MKEELRFELREDFSRHLGTCERSRPERALDLWVSLLRENLFLSDNGMTEQEARDAVSDLLPKAPIYALMDKVAEAIREYDRSGDHLRHGPGSDCIRCKLEDAIHNTYAGKAVRRS